MNSQYLKYFIIVVAALFGVIVLAFLYLKKKMDNNEEYKQVKRLQENKKSEASLEIIYQKLYVFYQKLPVFKRYLLKLRRRLEINNIDDEYLTRKQSSKILTNALIIVIPLTIIIILLNSSNLLLMCILLVFEVFLVDTLIDGAVDKIDNKLLTQQIEFFSEIRHAYHEYNMVEEAIYQVSQDDERPEMARQGEKIYEILISDDPEGELEKYYDVAPNAYLKEFAGISYLTKEFGDRTVDGSSLYLKNLNNISQEMQLEILKRDKLDYVFQSLSVIAIVPMLFLETIKKWAVSQFSFVKPFYYGKGGLALQMLTIVVTIICYLLTRKLKDNGSVNTKMKNTENPWQQKLYNIPLCKKIVNMFLPNRGTKEHRKVTQKLKESASKLKIEWLYINRIVLAVTVFILSMVVMFEFHAITRNWIYTEPTTDYDIIGGLSQKEEKKAMEVTEMDNYFLRKFEGDLDVTTKDIEKAFKKSKYYDENYKTDQLQTDCDRILGKLQKINSEYLKWFEVLLAMLFAVIGYMAPIWLLFFQIKIRKLEMEDEVMQYQTIILMLMKIERVNVEIILEWLERYSNIFKEPITKCVNNYESGAWEALEELKNDVTFTPFIRLVESMQAAVEKIPIIEAFDELDSERDYYQERRKESNERLISRKGLIGKAIGFAPMVVLFVGYLIIPLVGIGLTSMTTSFQTMSKM